MPIIQVFVSELDILAIIQRQPVAFNAFAEDENDIERQCRYVFFFSFSIQKSGIVFSVHIVYLFNSAEIAIYFIHNK